GARPDAGAFEFGRAKWTGGADARDATADTVAPPAPTAVAAVASAAGIRLDWADGLARDRSAYNLFVAASRTGSFKRLNAEPLRASEYLDRAAPEGAARFYRVVVLDTSGNSSAPSSTVAATRPPDPAARASATPTWTAV